MSDFDYDLFVIGGGSGGVRAARLRLKQGRVSPSLRNTAMAEPVSSGAVCLKS